MTKSIQLFSRLLVLMLFSAASTAGSITKCVDAAGHVTFTTMGCKTSETNASATTPTRAAGTNTPITSSTLETKSSTETNSAAIASTGSAQQPIAQPTAEPAANTSQQNDNPTGNKREKLGEGSADSVGVGLGF